MNYSFCPVAQHQVSNPVRIGQVASTYPRTPEDHVSTHWGSEGSAHVNTCAKPDNHEPHLYVRATLFLAVPGS